jgi:hypothetical protein
VAYTQTIWQEGGAPGISAARLNKIEQGIAEAHDEMAKVFLSSTEPSTPDTNTFWFQDVGEDYDPGGGGVVIENAALDGSEPIWLDEE